MSPGVESPFANLFHSFDVLLNCCGCSVTADAVDSKGAEAVLLPSQSKADALATPRFTLEAKREKLRQWLQQRAALRELELPLSEGQKALWFLCQISPENTAYNVPFAVRVRSRIDLDVFRQASQVVIDRHAAARTTFRQRGGEVVQVVHADRKLDFRRTDAMGWSETQISQQVADEVYRVFDLEQGPLVRCAVFSVSAEDHVLTFSVHHLIGDFLSLVVLMSELRIVYAAIAQGKTATLPPLKVDYGEFVRWQWKLITGPRGEELWEFWRKQLDGELPVLDLPIDKPRPSQPTFHGAAIRFVLEADLTRRLRALARKEGVTLFTLLLTAYKLLLHRYTGQNEICVGSPTTGRTAGEFAGLIGYFVNPVVFRSDLGGNPDFLSLLRREREIVLGALEHQDYPFAKLVERLQRIRQPNRAPVFQTMFVLDQSPLAQERGTASAMLGHAADFEFGGLRMDVFNVPTRSTAFELSLLMEDAEAFLTGFLQYDTDLFAAKTIERLSAHFQRLLEEIVADPRRSIAKLPLLSTGERDQMVVRWNATRIASATDRCLHDLFAEQVERTPAGVALVFEELQLTYAELEARANQLAHYLQRLGVGPSVRVGICVRRSVEMVIGLYGILKSGGAYVPLDPDYPTERLKHILAAAQPPILLIQAQLHDLVADFDGRILCLDTQWDKIAREPATRPVAGTRPQDLAYVIFTSGSTGIPKGVMIPHAGICNRLCWMQESLALNTTNRVLQKTPFCFDVSVWEFFGPLLCGSTLVVAKADGHRDPTYLVELILQTEVTTVHFVPSLLRAFVEEPSVSSCRSLRRVVCSGEALSLDLQHRFFRRLNCELHNLYGPTEASIEVTWWDCSQSCPSGSVPIGKPIHNTQTYVLNDHLQPQPAGVVGELYLGGIQLARGYLNRPNLTAERFVPSPFADAGERLYRTGDLVRYLTDGNIEFRGRLDHQVKIYGNRIELGEIESVLVQHPAIKQAVTLVREDRSGQKRLVSYVVPDEHTAPVARQWLQLEREGASEETKRIRWKSVAGLIQEMREHLAAHLPEYMAPQAFVLLEELPLLPNGKLNRKALPAPELGGLDQMEYAEPRTPTEEILARIVADVLGLERVGIYDNFFTVGGDSILSIQVISRIRAKGLDCSPLEFFQNQTVAKLAMIVRESTAPRAEQNEVVGPVPLTPMQHWFLDRRPLQPQHFNQSLLFEMHGRIHVDSLDAALRAMLKHHDALRLRLLERDGHWVQINAPASDRSCLTCIDLSRMGAAEQVVAMEVCCADAQASHDLGSGLLMRAIYFDLGAGRPGRLLLVVHHLAIDGVGWRILLQDLYLAYKQLSRGQVIALPPKTTSFREWAIRLHEYVTSKGVTLEAAYWRNVQSLGRTSRFPVERPDAENTEASVKQVVRRLDESLTEALLRHVPPKYHTCIDDVLLAALIHAFQIQTGRERLLVDVEGHGHEDRFTGIDVSRTVGWFTRIFPVVLETNASANPGALLRSVKEQLRAIPQQGVGYGLLRYLASDEWSAPLKDGPQANVSFNYLGQIDRGMFEHNDLFRVLMESKGGDRPKGAERLYALDVVGYVLGGRLQLLWHYSYNQSDRDTIEQFADAYMASLQRTIRHCLELDSGGYTPSDFPLANLDPSSLDRLTAQMRQIEDLYPLTAMQEGLLFHTLLEPECGVYVVQQSGTLEGELDLAALSAAWEQLIQRHALLRTSFVWDNLEHPLQVVHPRLRVPLVTFDWSALSAEEQEQRWQSLLNEERRRKWDLQTAPLTRFIVIDLAPQVYRFLWSQHHVLSDGWSLRLLLNELLVIYQASRQEILNHLPKPRPFRDYIEWIKRRDQISTDDFWRKQLQGFDEPTCLGIDRATAGKRLSTLSHRSNLFPISAQFTLQLEAFAREHQLTLNSIVRAAWALVLGRGSGREVALFGQTVSGRWAPLKGIETMIGPLINTLPMRVDLSSELCVLDWIQLLQRQSAELREYEHCSLVNIQRLSDVARGTPLFEYLYVFEGFRLDPSIVASAGLRVKLDDVGRADTHYPLVVVVIPGSQIRFRIDSAVDRFSAQSIRQLFRSLERALHVFVEHPDKPLAAVHLLTINEKQGRFETRDGEHGGSFGMDALPATRDEDEHFNF